MEKNVPLKRHPLFNDEPTLDFGEEIDITEKTNDQKVDGFLSKYMEIFNPVSTYNKYFESSAKGVDHILRDVKLYYRKLVIEGNWTERKYVAVINDIFENNTVFSVVTLDRGGKFYDKGLLASQQRAKKGRRRI